MVRSVRPRKIAALFTLLWFALYAGAPQLVHPCPEHAAGQVQAELAQETDAGAHAHHGAPTPAPADAPDTNDCCCPGPHCGTPVMVAGDDRSPLGASAALVRDAVSPQHVDRPTAHQAHVLPFATAPPSAAA